MALGVLPEAPFEALSVPLEAGDRLILYTDGFTDATNPQDETYGEERLRAFLNAGRATEPRALLEGLIADVIEHCGAARPGDDMTALCADRLRA
jgi:serine phosphatase RsbU (regulator of sigma subunit)